MEILLKRIAKKSDYTIGKLFIGEEYFCDTLEPTRTLLTDVETADGEEKTDLALVMPRDEQYDSFG